MRNITTHVAAMTVSGEVLDYAPPDLLPTILTRSLAGPIARTLAEFNKRGPRWTWQPVHGIKVTQQGLDWMRDTYTCYVKYKIVPR